MHGPIDQAFLHELSALDPRQADYAARFVERLLAEAADRSASDVHLLPVPDGLEIRWRIDGVLASVGVFPRGAATDVVTRLKVLADLLTYRVDLPQEGRIRPANGGIEMRVSTFPTLHGEKGVVRLFRADRTLHTLADLGLPSEIRDRLSQLLGETSGAILVTGPAGSGKSTTLYACLRELAARSGGGRSLSSIEDPIESALAGVAQSQVQPGVGFDFPTALRSILRQDPEVILVGEIRDRITAEVALQASLTGQLVLSSFHAGSAAGAMSRLADMGIEPYVLRSGVLAVLSQRLVRHLCSCARPANDPSDLLELPVRLARLPVGCPACLGSGYAGRMLVAEMLVLDGEPLAKAVLARADAATLERVAVADGMVRIWHGALAAVEAGQTSPTEIRRVLGFSGPPPDAVPASEKSICGRRA